MKNGMRRHGRQLSPEEKWELFLKVTSGSEPGRAVRRTDRNPERSSHPTSLSEKSRRLSEASTPIRSSRSPTRSRGSLVCGCSTTLSSLCGAASTKRSPCVDRCWILDSAPSLRVRARQKAPGNSQVVEDGPT